MSHEPLRLISSAETMRKICLGKTSLYLLVKNRELVPVKLGNKTAFVEQEVNAWIEKQIANRKVN